MFIYKNLIILFLIFFCCANNDISSVTETETGEITGRVVDENGFPVSGAMVILRYRQEDTTNKLSKIDLQNIFGIMQNDSMYSGINGHFSFKNIDTGTYYLECNILDSLGAIKTIQLNEKRRKAELNDVACLPMSHIEGKVENAILDEIDFLYIEKLDLRIEITASGYYSTKMIPAGSYKIQAVANKAPFSSYFDTLEIQVVPKKVTGIEYRSDSLYFTNDQNTVALWSFTEVNSNTINDHSFNNNDLKLFKLSSITTGKYSGAVHFTDSGYGVVAPHQSLNPATITIETVIFLDSLPSPTLKPRPHQMIVSLNDFGDTTYGYELRISDSAGYAEFVIGTVDGWKSALSTETLFPGRWYKIVGVFDGKEISVFVDNELWARTSYVGSIQYTNTYITIGRRYEDSPFYFNGKIDEIRISSIAR
jgi:hypothetical protein